MGRRALFRELLAGCRKAGVEFVRMDALARGILRDPGTVPVCDQVQATIDGRSGLVAAAAR